MISIRLESELEVQLAQYSERKNLSKSQVVKEALASYFAQLEAEEQQKSPFQLGEDLFGKYASGQHDRSVNYKQQLKDKLRAKNAH
jgi:RHH-type transcriptional regulator, rel operon repressor / antitoxin RelB